MIITCNNCNKNFEINSNLIPENGRLLQCSSCSHKWFFKKEIKKNYISTAKIHEPTEKPKIFNKEMGDQITESKDSIELLDPKKINSQVVEEISINSLEEKNLIIKKYKSKKSYTILSVTIVFIITFIALVIVIDTFQNPISKIIPNIEFFLYNLYESINDIVLFFKDLI
tara:strand:+ start:512 stop:1021 length:510 start_codon:yes stop_codon:yes gene_type:complete